MPHRILGIDFRDETGPPAFFFLELDRGTMPIVRRQLHRTSFLKKLVGYHASWQAWLKKASPYGFNNFRVLTVTTTPEQADKRLANLLAAAKELPGGHGLFLFTTYEALGNARDPLSHAWTNGRGNAARPTD